MDDEKYSSLTVKLREEFNDLASPLYLPSKRKTKFENAKTYIIIGGLGGFAMELAIWMWERGVRNFILTSRTSNINSYNRYCIQRLRLIGVRIIVCHKNFIFLEQGTCRNTL